MNWFGWVLLIAAVGGVLWWLSGGNRTAVRTGPKGPAGRGAAGRESARNVDHADEHGDQESPH